MSFFIDAGEAFPAGVRAGSTRRFGLGASRPPFDALNLGLPRSLDGDAAQDVMANRRALREALGLPAEPRWLRQVHGVGVIHFSADDKPDDGAATRATGALDAAPEADAAVTRDAGVVLAVLHADCLPLLLCSADGAVLGAAHAGWRGLAAGVIEATVAAMQVPGASLRAWLGPAAGPQHYEIDAPVREAFLDRDAGAASTFVATRPGHWRMDLYALARRRLSALGVTAVQGGARCTIGEPQAFFSHRRDARTGRMASLIWRPSVPFAG